MNQLTIILGISLLGFVAQCRGCSCPRSEGTERTNNGTIQIPPQPVNPCDQGGIGFAPVGKIHKAVPDRNFPNIKYTVVLSDNSYYMIDGSARNIQLEIFAGQNIDFKFDLRSSPYNPNHYYVCSVSVP
jgi:hypothetical protein